MEQNVANEELFLKVVSALDELRPFLHEDGGDFEIVDITPEKVLKIQFVGACGSCSMNNMTLRMVLKML